MFYMLPACIDTLENGAGVTLEGGQSVPVCIPPWFRAHFPMANMHLVASARLIELWIKTTFTWEV